ncbi:MAG: phosphomethylpyrimidine synthase ThiC [candidate division NC10 bacterium]|nr:phosphomethylpyrimidine synthase ThiC [candidate division NC10 bacterium]
MTQLERALRGEITPQMQEVAKEERIDPSLLCQRIARGTVVIPANKNHRGLKPMGIGEGLRTKVNANVGTSSDFPDVEREVEKARAAARAGADTIMDLSTGGDIDRARSAILAATSLPLGTVPIYQAAIEAIDRHGDITRMEEEELFEVIERHAKDGVDFITVHCGVTLETIRRLREQGRITDIVSRGGAFLNCWMLRNERENPLFERFDRLLEIAARYDVTLSLGDGLRPGCLADATDRAQIQELIILGELVERAWAAGVQVMVEGPGHVPLDQIEANIRLQKRLCKGAPFYVLGPLVTDVAPGYDHITAAIGGALAAAAGADYICYVTPSEHLGLPTAEEVKEGVIAARIAGHAADLVKKIPGAWAWDQEMARERKALNWQGQIDLSIDPEKAARYRKERSPAQEETCTMCGEFCAMKLTSQIR